MRDGSRELAQLERPGRGRVCPPGVADLPPVRLRVDVEGKAADVPGVRDGDPRSLIHEEGIPLMTAQNPWTKAEKAFAAAKKAMIAADRYFNSAAFQYSEGTSHEAACVAKLKQLQRDAQQKAAVAHAEAGRLKRWAELFAMDAEMLNSIIGRHGVGMWEHYTEEFVTFQKRER